jgi:hypothetical protein
MEHVKVHLASQHLCTTRVMGVCVSSSYTPPTAETKDSLGKMCRPLDLVVAAA